MSSGRSPGRDPRRPARPPAGLHPSRRRPVCPPCRAWRRCPAGCRATGPERGMGPNPQGIRPAGTGDDLGLATGRRRPARCSATQPCSSIGSTTGKPASASRGRGTAGPRRSAELLGPAQGGGQRTTILLARAVVSQCDLELADEHGQRGPQLVGGIAAEPPLALVGDVQTGQQVVERAAQEIELVAGPGLGQAPAGVGGVEPACRLDQRDSGARARRESPRQSTAAASQIPALRAASSQASVASVASIGPIGAQTISSIAGWRTSARSGAGGSPPRSAARARRTAGPRAGGHAGTPPGAALPIQSPPRPRPAGQGPFLREGLRIGQVARVVDPTPAFVEDQPSQPIGPGLLSQREGALLRLPLHALGMDLGRRGQDRQRRVEPLAHPAIQVDPRRDVQRRREDQQRQRQHRQEQRREPPGQAHVRPRRRRGLVEISPAAHLWMTPGRGPRACGSSITCTSSVFDSPSKLCPRRGRRSASATAPGRVPEEEVKAPAPWP